MPPNKLVKDAQAQAKSLARRALLRLPWARRAADALGMPALPPRQRYYPQCGRCSQLQAAAIRTGRMRLVFHEVLHRGGTSSAWHVAGTLVGLRHYSGGGAAAGGGNGARRYYYR